MEGRYYVRLKSSLTGRRVKQDPAFAVTMQYAHMLGTASGIAAAVYKQLGKEQKVKGLYRKMTGEAMRMLKTGETTEQVAKQLAACYLPETITRQPRPVKIKRETPAQHLADALLAYIFSAEETGTASLHAMAKEAAPT